MASSTLVWLLPTISLSRYTWSLTVALLVLPRRRWRRYDRSLARTTSVRRESRRGDSNPEPLDYKSSALPIAPRRQSMGTSPGARIGTTQGTSEHHYPDGTWRRRHGSAPVRVAVRCHPRAAAFISVPLAGRTGSRAWVRPS